MSSELERRRQANAKRADEDQRAYHSSAYLYVLVAQEARAGCQAYTYVQETTYRYVFKLIRSAVPPHRLAAVHRAASP